MRLSISKSKNTTYLSVIKTVYENKKQITKRVEKLGTVAELEKKLNGQDHILWARQYIDTLNKKGKSANKEVLIKNLLIKLLIDIVKIILIEVTYFLKIFITIYVLTKFVIIFKIDILLNMISTLFYHLIFSRIIYPPSKLSSFEYARKYIEQPNFELSHIYKVLKVLLQESDFIQAILYKNLKILK